MNNRWILAIITILFTSCIKDRFDPVEVLPPVEPGNRTVVHYWNFNSGSSYNAIIAPTHTIGGGALDYTAVGDPVNEGTDMNAQGNDPAGAALRLRNPAGVFTISLPTVNCTDVLLRFAATRTVNGAQENTISYTLDGTNYITTGLQQTVLTISETWSLYSIDFSAIAGVNDNPNFKVRIEYRRGNTNDSGNNRYDNITLFANYTAPANPFVLLHYWNFNGGMDPSYTIGDADWAFATSETLNVDNGVDGTGINARNGDPAGAALRLRETKDGVFTLSLPTTGHEKIKLTFAATSTTSNNAPQGGTVTYTVDGVNYTDAGLSKTAFTIATRETFQEEQFDFTGISGVDNNPNFKVRIHLTMPSPEANAGNLRVDNITLEGVANDNLPDPPPPATATEELLHYWNFNNNTNASFTIGNAAWVYTTSGVVNTDNGVDGSGLNAQNGDAAGNALRLRETKDGEFVLTVPTTGFKDVQLAFAATSTTSGSAPQGGTISYSLDGSNFVETGLTNNAFTIATRETFQLETFDLSAVSGAANNPNFKIKIKLTMPTPEANAGNLRVDNITLKGIRI